MTAAFIVLYVLGASLAYAMAPLAFPISCEGRTAKRIIGSLLWPGPAFAMFLACLATNFA